MIEKVYGGDTMSVAPFTGAWIEIISRDVRYYRKQVAPFTGAWIEIARL